MTSPEMRPPRCALRNACTASDRKYRQAAAAASENTDDKVCAAPFLNPLVINDIMTATKTNIRRIT